MDPTSTVWQGVGFWGFYSNSFIIPFADPFSHPQPAASGRRTWEKEMMCASAANAWFQKIAHPEDIAFPLDFSFTIS